MLASNQSSMLAASDTLYNDTAVVVRKAPVADGFGGVTRPAAVTLFASLAVNVQTPPPDVKEDYARQSVTVNAVLYTITDVRSLRLNDVATVGGVTYVVKAAKDMGGRHRNFAIYAERKD